MGVVVVDGQPEYVIDGYESIQMDDLIETAKQASNLVHINRVRINGLLFEIV